MDDKNIKDCDSECSGIWNGFKFPTGVFMVWSKDGRMAYGKCDPITKEVLEWHERELENESM
jgi:hypothetical protein